jgi:hypothetical protein
MQRNTTCLFEILEPRKLLSVAPTITTFTSDPQPLTRGEKLTLAVAATDTDGTVKSVDFFIDTDVNGTFDPAIDKRIARDTSPNNGFTGVVSVDKTKKLQVGNVGYFAVATDNSKDTSDAVPIVVIVQNSAPTVKGVNLAPKKVAAGKKLNINLTGIKDVDGKVTSAVFYEDTNANGTIEVGADTLLGTDADPKGGLKLTVEPTTTEAFATGEHVILAQATDSDGAVSNVVTSTLTVTAPKGGGGAPGIDLNITNATFTPHIVSKAGSQTFVYQVKARNLGSTTSAGFGYSVWLSSNTTFGDSDDLLLTTAEAAPLAGGQSRTDTNSQAFSTSGIDPAIGNYFVIVKIDAGDTITEINELNNLFTTSTASLTITA